MSNQEEKLIAQVRLCRLPYNQLLSRCADLEVELARINRIKDEVSREFLIEIPEPGTKIEKLLHANIIMRRYEIPELKQHIERLETLLETEWNKR